MARSVHDRASDPVRVITIVDADDEQLEGYAEARSLEVRVLPERLGFTGSLNLLAAELWDEYDVLGAFGDDVLFRSRGWDVEVRRALRSPGIAYGDDLIHGRNHPTAVFMSSSIAKALGWLALPAVWHTWADDAWKRLGQELDVLRFMRHVVVEHMHPAVGKAEWDPTYERVYSKEVGDHDYLAYAAWLENGLASDLEKVRAVLR